MNLHLRTLADRPFVVPAGILAICLLLGLLGISYGLLHRAAGSTISVTGSATEDVTADTASWAIGLSRTTTQDGLTSAYTAIGHDAAAVASYLNEQKFASSTPEEGVVTTNPIYPSSGAAPTTYTVTENVTIRTSDVQKVDALSHNLSAAQGLISTGTILSPEAPAYYVSTLPQLRVSLVGKAVADAKARAKEIAKSGGSVVGALNSASSGVVQVTPMNSTSADDYGSYDTTTIKKQVMVTAHASFYVQ
jgi:hypothetical protein